MARWQAWLGIGVLTVAMTVLTSWQALQRYEIIHTGWSWDLAYYNQWYWKLTQGNGILTVRPLAPYATEGPSVWKMNYLAPIRVMLVPVYVMAPGPKTLLVIHSVFFWLAIPAAFTLVKSETRSYGIAFGAAVLVPITPLAWPLVWNDFRELQMATGFVLWAVQGWRSRHLGLALLGAFGMLACRQEFAVVIATLAILPPREPEDIGKTHAWMQGALLGGVAWILLAFFGYLEWNIGWRAPENYMSQFGGPKAAIGETLETAADFLLVGMGSWAILMLFAPRAALMAFPWVWSLSNGKWALRFLTEGRWHQVRYTAPMFAVVLAAGLLGYARIANRTRRKKRPRLVLDAIWAAALFGLLAANIPVQKRMAQIPWPLERDEVQEYWRWVHQVAPEDGVLAVYEVTAPLSSRETLYSYVMDQNKPPGYPNNLGPEFRWVFLKNGDIPPQILFDQGFELVHQGDFLQIYYRTSDARPPQPKKIVE